MTVRGVMIGMLVLSVAVCSATAWAGAKNAADEHYAQGDALLAKADFQGAFAAYSAAAKADPDKPEYRMKAALVRRVIKARESLEKTDDAEKWLRTATGLHAFYSQNEIHGEALALALKIHTRQPTADSAAMLARTRLAMDMNQDAAEGLNDLPEDQATDEIRVLMGIALARQDQVAQAKELLQGVGCTKDSGTTFLYDLARLHALTGDTKAALHTLTCYFENTPPSRLPDAKEHVGLSGDFASLRDTAEFVTVFATKSAVPESKCSSGASCGKCPSRGGCSASKKTDTSCEPDKKSDHKCSGHDHKPQP